MKILIWILKVLKWFFTIEGMGQNDINWIRIGDFFFFFLFVIYTTRDVCLSVTVFLRDGQTDVRQTFIGSSVSAEECFRLKILWQRRLWGSPRGESFRFLQTSQSWGHQSQITLWPVRLWGNQKRRLVLPILAGCPYFTWIPYLWMAAPSKFGQLPSPHTQITAERYSECALANKCKSRGVELPG